MFDYHLGLHPTQTVEKALRNRRMFDYHLGLHPTQTPIFTQKSTIWFDYHLGLHPTQTSNLSSFAFPCRNPNGREYNSN